MWGEGPVASGARSPSGSQSTPALRVLYQRHADSIFDASTGVSHFQFGDNSAGQAVRHAAELDYRGPADSGRDVGNNHVSLLSSKLARHMRARLLQMLMVSTSVRNAAVDSTVAAAKAAK